MSERGPYAKGRARREEIVATASRVMAQNGYHNTSMRSIGRELGIQPAHILHYFSSKEALLEAVLREWDARTPEIWGTEIGDAESVRGDILTGWVDMVRENMRIPGLVHLYTAFAAEASEEKHPSHAFFRERFDRLRARVTTSIERGQREGTIRGDVDAARTAIDLIAFSDGLQLQWLIDPSIDMAGRLQGMIDGLRAST